MLMGIFIKGYADILRETRTPTALDTQEASHSKGFAITDTAILHQKG